MELDLRKLASVVLKRLWIIILSAVLVGAIAFTYTYLCVKPTYTSTAKLYVYNYNDREGKITSSDITSAQKLVETYVAIMQSNTVMNEVAEKVGMGYTAAKINRMFSAGAYNDTEIILISVTGSNPEDVQLIASAITEVAPDEIIRIVKAGDVTILDTASYGAENGVPIQRNTILGVLIGFIISLLIVLFIEILDTRIKSEEDLTDLFTVPVIGTVPEIIDIAAELKEGRRNG